MIIIPVTLMTICHLVLTLNHDYTKYKAVFVQESTNMAVPSTKSTFSRGEKYI